MSAATSSAGGTVRRPLRVLGATVLALLAGVLTAGPAAAVEDPSRPGSRVTHGPSCRPGGVVVEVVAGTAPYAVVLATTRAPDGEDSAELEAGGTATLSTGGAAWGETIDGWLEYRALDGSGTAWVEQLAGYAFTRPAEEDCAAITAPAAAATVPGPPPGPARVIDPGGSAAEEQAVEVVEGAVDLATTATVPAALGTDSSPAPLLVAAVALGAAAAGLAGSLGPRRRRPTPGA